MIVYFIRHGKTNLNLEKRISGARTDAPLSDKGIAELKEYVKEKIYPSDPGNCYTSDLKRTWQTIQAIYPERSYKHTVLLNERDFGEIETETDKHKIIQWRKSIFDEKGNEREEVFGKGECTRVFAERVERDFHKFLEQRFANGEQRITICGHGAYLRQIGANYGLGQLGDYKYLICNGKGLVFDVIRTDMGKYSLQIVDFVGGKHMEDVMEVRQSLE
ncbi:MULTISPECIES: phosphoglycerate mutase family protein [Mediterraneibacter]|uniref:phosphoglycerate mutase family protein n=1 Tax=Mediterraneibacter TaxID=2316020 RepID=UPI0022E1BFAB|nr:phosphoglycerate mutase family protein [Mediterraneibacter massiliensis]